MEDLSIRIFTADKLILTVGEEYHEIKFYDPEKELKKGFGYIYGNYVYVYRGKYKNFFEDRKSGLYKQEDGEHVFVEPSAKEKEDYNVNRVVELDIDKMFEELENREDNFIDPDDIEVINNNQEAWIPTIREDDDFLKYIVKKAIIDKKINLKNYRGKFTNQYALNNMKSGLNKDTKMTVTNFKIWCEILGLVWEMDVRDNGQDRLNPLPEEIIITSDSF